MRLGGLFCAFFMYSAALGQSLPEPRFKEYAVLEQYTGPQAAARLKPGTAAWSFRTRIREAARQKPNFAGHYVLATWGCGAECLSFAIIDVKTGAVHFDDMSLCCWFSPALPEKPEDFEPVRFRLNSRLVIMTGMLNEEGRNAPHYFQFEHGKLAAIR
ncbi:hypothetical protein [Hymenobacter properus]|uniref:Uncharacterized protein n=1 Tax=Hymenobacter properus TaxID=2791026 RepID=A0A931BKS4_9BACT|nr:hypothetical protein [Hymenobacter properus]MBF9144038.1 hypothetical protein [Hymenobacter properus]MBR7722855.1 hypothetical protein [Microvirga sp. SRT04]